MEIFRLAVFQISTSTWEKCTNYFSSCTVLYLFDDEKKLRGLKGEEVEPKNHNFVWKSYLKKSRKG